MSGSYVLSVVVPTRNRAEYALGAIRQVLSIDAPDIQLVVQDNSDDDSLRDLCAQHLDDKRFTYNYSPGTLSFVDNFGVAVGLTEGEYISVIGDDDGINPELLEVARWAQSRGVDAIKPGLQTVYFWPGVGLHVPGDAGQLIVDGISGAVRVSSTEVELARLMRDGCQEYLNRNLVKLYHGLVRKQVLERVRERTGRYFGGLSPDIYAAVALSSVTHEVVCLDYPLTISGICRTSGSADSATGRHTGDLRDAPHFKGHDDYQWAPEVPQFYSVETIWADSGLAAVKEMQRTDLVARFGSQYLTAYCLRRHPAYRELVREHYFALQLGRGMTRARAALNLSVAQASVAVSEFARRVRRKLTSTLRGDTRLDDVADISAAADVLARHLAANGLEVGSCLKRLDAVLPARGGES